MAKSGRFQELKEIILVASRKITKCTNRKKRTDTLHFRMIEICFESYYKQLLASECLIFSLGIDEVI